MSCPEFGHAQAITLSTCGGWHKTQGAMNAQIHTKPMYQRALTAFSNNEKGCAMGLNQWRMVLSYWHNKCLSWLPCLVCKAAPWAGNNGIHTQANE
jgi:hypothetical protein